MSDKFSGGRGQKLPEGGRERGRGRTPTDSSQDRSSSRSSSHRFDALNQEGTRTRSSDITRDNSEETLGLFSDHDYANYIETICQDEERWNKFGRNLCH